MNRLRSWAELHLLPPHGLQVRRLVIMIALSIALPRLLHADLLRFGIPTVWIDEHGTGLAFLVAAVWLGISTHRLRYSWFGRLAAVYGAVVFAGLAATTWETSTVSVLVNLSCAYALIGEAAAHG